jgi:hypothetical protein
VADPVSRYLAEIGRKGGAAGRGLAKARPSEQARKAALARWAGKRKARRERGAKPAGIRPAQQTTEKP